MSLEEDNLAGKEQPQRVEPKSVLTKHNLSPLTKLLILFVPILAFAGYYQYSLVSGASFFGVTLTSSVNLENGLVGHWTFDGAETAATTTLDRSGYNNTGTMTNSPTKVIGKIGQGLSLDGTDDYTQVANNAVLDFTTDYTLSAWIYPTLRDSYNPIFVRGTGDTDDIEVYIASSTGTQHLTIGHNRGNGGTFEYVADGISSGVSGNGGW